MPAKKYRIELTTEEQQELKALVSKGRGAVQGTGSSVQADPCTHPVAER